MSTIQQIYQCMRHTAKPLLLKRSCSGTWSRRLRATQNKKFLATAAVLNSKTSEQEIDKDGLNITENCIKQMKKVASPSEFLRVSVDGGGCSGFSYKFELGEEIQEDDKTFERNGIKVVCDEGSLQLIKGSSIDYEEELIKSAFRVKNNPQSSTSCSCGVSFSID